MKINQPPQNNKYLKVLSLFSGCGGMDLGFEGGFYVHKKSINQEVHPDWNTDKLGNKWLRLPKTKFKTIFANDIFQAARAAWTPYFSKNDCNLKRNFQLTSLVDLVKSHCEGKLVFPEADVVTGGFPCQDFSVSGKRKGFNSHKAHHGKLLSEVDDPNDDNRGKLYMWMKRTIEVVLPKVFVAENVKGLVSLNDVKQIIENDFRNIGSGYLVVNARVLRASTYGVPQNRERVFFIGFRKDALTKEAIEELSKSHVRPIFDPYPRQTHCAHHFPESFKIPVLPFVTAGDYIADLAEPEESQDPSQQAYSKAKWYGSHCQGQTEVDLSGIGPTIRAEHHGNIEFRRLSEEHGGKYKNELKAGLQERRLTVRECARLQTFPDDFEFVRDPLTLGKEFKISASEGYKLVGNAVPPLLAFHIAWRLQELWDIIIK